MTFYTKKPVTIEAFQLGNGDLLPDWASINENLNIEINDSGILVAEIKPHEGNLNGGQAISGNYIIKGIKGEIYTCEADIFEATYDVADIAADGEKQDSQEAESA